MSKNKTLHLAICIPTIIYASIIIVSLTGGISWNYILHSTMFTYFAVFGITEIVLILYRVICRIKKKLEHYLR